MKICINPGHGPKNVGYDPGAVGPTGKKEAEQVLKIAEVVERKLKANGHSILLVHDGDLGDVAKKSNAWGADYFISIHRNAHANRTANGIETYALAPGGQAEKLAKVIQSELVQAFRLINRGVKFANYQVLRQTNCPAVLTELGFISHPQEELLFESRDNIEKAAEAICIGLSKFAGIPYSSSRAEASKPNLVIYGSDVEKRVAPYLAEWLKCEVRELGDRTLTKAYLEATFEKVYVLGNAAKLSSNTVNIVGIDRFDTARKTLDLCK